MKKIFGFSLVEIVVALIIISVITAALAPIITKKMKSNQVSITGGSGGGVTSEITTQCTEKFSSSCKLCTNSYCIQCELDNCASGTYVENKSCSCKTCDYLFPNCVECDNTKCTKCKDNNYYIKDGVCTNCPSDKICDGVNAYDESYCDNPPDGYYCDGGNIKKCVDKYSLYCSTCNATQCLSCQSGYYLSGKQCLACISGCDTCSNSTTCQKCSSWAVLNSTSNKCVSCWSTSVIPNCQFCTSTTNCTKCMGGYYINSSKKCSPCTDIANCTQCSNSSTCTLCASGYFLNSSNSCSPCSISNCSICNNDGTCTICNQGYTLSEDKKSCEKDDGKFNCSDGNFIKIGNLCVTRKNMGDSSTLRIPNTITVVKPSDEYCYSETEKCCWSGATGGTSESTSCNDNNGGYSGCNRTVCNYNAAKEICAKFNYGGKVWRLATLEEAQSWKTATIGLGSNGMMLCTHLESGVNVTLCPQTSYCKGADLNRCTMWHSFLESSTDGLTVPSADISAGNFNFSNISPMTASSVRCVTEMDDE